MRAFLEGKIADIRHSSYHSIQIYPDCEFYDPIHSKDEGVLLQMCDNWFISTNHSFGYFLGPHKPRDITL